MSLIDTYNSSSSGGQLLGLVSKKEGPIPGSNLHSPRITVRWHLAHPGHQLHTDSISPSSSPSLPEVRSARGEARSPPPPRTRLMPSSLEPDGWGSQAADTAAEICCLIPGMQALFDEAAGEDVRAA